MNLIGFMSDFGLQDPYAGIVKAVMAGINPHIHIIDITHHISAHDIAAGALVLETAYGNFPAGSIFLAVVDPGVGSDRAGILAVSDRYSFVAPDNGVLSRIFKLEGELTCYRIENRAFFPGPVSNTFHARDIFGPAATHLSLGTPPPEFGPIHHEPVRIEWPEPVIGPEGITGQVIHVDGFGSLLTNIPYEIIRQQLPGKHAASVSIGSRVIPVHRTYSDVPPGSALALSGSSGLLEIAVNQGSARDLLEAGPGTPVTVT